MHVKIGPSFDKRGKSVEDYLEKMKKTGIDKAVLCPNRPDNYSFKDGNAYVAEALQANPERFYGAVRIDPWNWDESKEEADKYLNVEQYAFLYLNPWDDTFRVNDPVAEPIYQYATKKQIPIIIETGYPYVSHISQIGTMAEKYPKTIFVTTNAGQIDLSGFTLADVGYMLNMYKNIYVGTAAAVGAEWLANQIQNTSCGRVLFETGYPFFDPYMEKYRIEKAYIKDFEKEDVFCNNFLKLVDK